MAANETREMRLFTKVIEQARKVPDKSLPEFIARRRRPGPDWSTWDEIRFELRAISGEVVSDQTIRGWARRYGIPEYTEPDGSVKPSRHGPMSITEADYLAALDQVVILPI